MPTVPSTSHSVLFPTQYTGKLRPNSRDGREVGQNFTPLLVSPRSLRMRVSNSSAPSHVTLPRLRRHALYLSLVKTPIIQLTWVKLRLTLIPVYLLNIAPHAGLSFFSSRQHHTLAFQPLVHVTSTGLGETRGRRCPLYPEAELPPNSSDLTQANGGFLSSISYPFIYYAYIVTT